MHFQYIKVYINEKNNRSMTKQTPILRNVRDTAIVILSQTLLDLNRFTRITTEAMLKHPFFTEQDSRRQY